MKTEQEQIEEMQEIIGDCWEFDSVSAELGNGDGYINIEEAAKALVQAGYGDVSEYKSEIERLKSNNGFLQCVISHSKDMMDEAVKQAQIDVLNKVKTLIFQKDNPYNVPFEEFISANVFCGYIDELIKEVENDK